MNSSLARLYYFLKPLIPRRLQLAARRQIVALQRMCHANVWPIDERSKTPPDWWSGWPEGKRFALVLTHDVETAKGHDNCAMLADLEESLGFRSSFNFVAKDYPISPELKRGLVKRGFEVGVHGLHHTGELYSCERKFLEQSAEINRYLREWDAVGFRTPCMYHNLDWLHSLEIEYDASMFDTDPFEPQPDGARTIFPFWAQNGSEGKGFVELPYTLPQDFTLFVLMREKGIHIWKRKLDWIANNGGMALLITHPDYVCSKGRNCGMAEYSIELYEELLHFVKDNFENQFWNPLPKEMARFWRENAGGAGHAAGYSSATENSAAEVAFQRLSESNALAGRRGRRTDSSKCSDTTMKGA